MNKLALALAVFLIVAAQPVQSQDMWAAYRQFLPPSVDTSETLRTQIVTLLQAKGEIHPELLYFYLAYYRVVLTDSVQSHGVPRSEWPGLLTSVERSYLDLRADWLSAQRRSMDTMSVAPEVRERLLYLFAGKERPAGAKASPSPELNSIDSSVMNYLVLRFIDRFDVSVFDPRLDYEQLRRQAELAAVDQLPARLEAVLHSNDKTSFSQSEALLRSWYLFSSRGSDIRPSLASILSRFISRTGSTKPKPTFGASVLVAPVDYLFRFKHSVPLNNSTEFLDLGQQLHGTSAGLSVNYKWFVREYYGIFSYLDLRLQGIFMITKPEMTLFQSFDTRGSEGRYATRSTLYLRKGHFSTSSQIALLARISTPLVVLLERLPIEMGLTVGITRIAYDLEYSYRYVHQLLNADGTNHYYGWADTETPANPGTVVQSRAVISPSLNASIPLSESLCCSLSFGVSESYVSFDFDF